MGLKSNVTRSVRQTLADYEVGDRLPGVAEVCETYDVGTSTAVYAMRALVTEGLVSSTQGRYGGYFLAKHPESAHDHEALLERLDELLAEAGRITSILQEAASKVGS
jgi:DNA-binding GntR family transcriptional regulator